MAKTISEAKAKAQLAELLTRVAEQGERFVIERDGKPIAALVTASDLARMEAKEKTGPEWKGFLSLVGRSPELDPAEIDAMVAEIYAAREREIPRPVDPDD
jgi:prevent-host-death family protein